MVENTFFEILFDKEDSFTAGPFYATRVRSVFPVTSGMEFFTVNPIHEEINYAADVPADRMTPKRSDLNVTKFRNFVFEMDSIPLERQEKLLEESGIPWSTITFSGSKSYHAIISLENPLNLDPHSKTSVVEYKKVWKKIAAYMDDLAAKMGYCKEGEKVIDSSCSNPSRLTRFPNSLRADKMQVQKVIKLGSRILEGEFKDLLEKCPDIKISNITKFAKPENVTETEKIFMLRASLGLISKLKYVTFGAEHGMYHETYKLMLWAIDETNLTKDLAVKLFEKYVIPKLITVHNYHDKTCANVYSAIDDAFNFKRNEYLGE